MRLHRNPATAALLCGFALIHTLPAQTKAPVTTTGTTTGTTGTGTSSLPTLPGRNTPTNTNPTTSAPIQRSIFLSGKVMTDDGSPLPMGVAVERVCGANIRVAGYTDSKGHFSFEWGKAQGVLPDASSSASSDSPFGISEGNATGLSANSSFGGGNFSSENQMANCELRAAAPGFRSDVVHLNGHRSMDDPNVGTIVLHRLAGVEGSSVSATSYNAPKDAKKAFERGMDAFNKGKTAEALKNFDKAVDSYPKYADAWFRLGLTKSQSGDTAGAKEAYGKALEADSKLVGPYVEMGLISMRQSDWRSTADALDRAVRLDPIDYPQAWYGSAVAHYNMKEYAAAEKSIREVIRLDVKHARPRAGYLLGLILAEKQDLDGAVVQLRAYLKVATDPKEIETVQNQIARIEKFAANRQK